jgi:uncharacterized protein YbaP (TraB family)
MSPRPWLVLGAVLLGLALPATAVAKAPPDTVPGTLFVWQVAHPDDWDGQPDYLAGTIHLALPAGKRLPQPALDCLAASNCFVMEADVDTLQPDAVVPFIFRQDKGSNEGHLSPKAWQRAVQQASLLGFPPDQVARLEPWFLTTFLGVGANDPNRSRDMLLRRQAENLALPVRYLEKAVDQLQMMRSLPTTYFFQQIEALEDATAKAEALADAYEKGDLASLEKATFDQAEMRRYPAVYQRLFYDRNTRWMPAVEDVLRRQRAFIAVGLGHLIGDQGLLKRLAAKGYRVSPVPMDRPETVPQPAM